MLTNTNMHEFFLETIKNMPCNIIYQEIMRKKKQNKILNRKQIKKETEKWIHKTLRIHVIRGHGLVIGLS